MFHLVKHVLRWVVVLGIFWAVVTYGLPKARGVIPGVCAAWKLAGGVCGPEVQNALAVTDGWVQRVLRPLPRHARVQQAVGEVTKAWEQVETLLRQQVGDERANAALRGADIALQRLEAAVGETGDVKAKLGAVPENAQALLTRVRAAFDRLRAVLLSTSRRAEDVSQAVDETKKALDALSSVLPEKK